MFLIGSFLPKVPTVLDLKLGATDIHKRLLFILHHLFMLRHSSLQDSQATQPCIVSAEKDQRHCHRSEHASLQGKGKRRTRYSMSR